ncbi:hypothetical protein JYJ95_09350 [Corallococcus exiguus]|uniref:hypothetical protein n=1 Tax=Corallococcus exiguus TaxID=83462 RepID=UPI001A8D39A8|nr:hypothetical protein [Corallococcus exiguus]MBN8466720.1 hypothetical protein [Corallococcus exiguus]
MSEETLSQGPEGDGASRALSAAVRAPPVPDPAAETLDALLAHSQRLLQPQDARFAALFTALETSLGASARQLTLLGERATHALQRFSGGE